MIGRITQLVLLPLGKDPPIQSARHQDAVPRPINICPPSHPHVPIFFFFLHTYLEGPFEAPEFRVVGQETCIAQRGVNCSVLSFGIVLLAIFDVLTFRFRRVHYRV